MSDNNQQQQPTGDRMDRLERGLEHLLRAQAEHETASGARFQTLTEALIRLTGVVEHLAEAQRAYGEETDRRFRATAERFQATAERFRDTDERLNALIKIVDGVIGKRPPAPPAS